MCLHGNLLLVSPYTHSHTHTHGEGRAAVGQADRRWVTVSARTAAGEKQNSPSRPEQLRPESEVDAMLNAKCSRSV